MNKVNFNMGWSVDGYSKYALKLILFNAFCTDLEAGVNSTDEFANHS